MLEPQTILDRVRLLLSFIAPTGARLSTDRRALTRGSMLPRKIFKSWNLELLLKTLRKNSQSQQWVRNLTKVVQRSAYNLLT